MSCGSNSKESRLAEEYKYLLSNIRPLIEQLDKSKDAQLCLLWLSKLHQCSRYEKCERNSILSELSRQVKNKCLEPPFNSQPPPGPLRYIVLNNPIPFWERTEPSEEVSSEGTTDSKSVFSSCSNESYLHEHCRATLIPWKGRANRKGVGCFGPIMEIKEDHAQCLSIQKKYHNRVVNDQLLIQRYQEIMKALITQKLKNAESSSSKLKSMKSSYEGKICDLTSSLEKLEEENSDLRERLLTSVVPTEKLKNSELENCKLREKIGHLEVENDLLGAKCRELEKEKSSALCEMGSRLNDSERRLRESDDHLRAMEKKHEENLLEWQSQHEAEVSALEKRYTNELTTLENILGEKQKEIGLLREHVATQCVHFEEEVLRLKRDILQESDSNKERRKIKFLRNKLKKSEKLQENMGMAFQAQFEQMIARKDLIISTLEMRLNTRSAESARKGALCERDDSLSERVCLLEEQYRKLLEESESQKILLLEKQLLNQGCEIQELNSITYPENLMLTAPSENDESIAYVEESK